MDMTTVKLANGTEVECQITGEDVYYLYIRKAHATCGFTTGAILKTDLAICPQCGDDASHCPSIQKARQTFSNVKAQERTGD